MGFSDAPVFLKVALGILPIALILDIVGVATPNWSGLTVGQYSSSLGFWKFCGSSGEDETVCNEYPDVLDWLKACRAFGIIGILAMLATTVLEVLCTFVFSKVTHKMFPILTTIIAFGGGKCALIFSIDMIRLPAEIYNHNSLYNPSNISCYDTLLTFLMSYIIWGAKYSDDASFGEAMSMLSTASYNLSWSFGLSIAGAILSAVGGASVAVVTFQN